MNQVNQQQMVEILESVYAKALDGIPGASPSIDQLADDYLSKHGNPKQAARELAKWQVAKCGTSGFVAGLGGLITPPVAIPANIASVLYVQLRMVAAMARMGGYDVRSEEVMKAVLPAYGSSYLKIVIGADGWARFEIPGNTAKHKASS